MLRLRDSSIPLKEIFFRVFHDYGFVQRKCEQSF